MSDVFTNPKSEAAKRLVFPDGADPAIPVFASDSVIRLVYNGAKVADTPLIAKMAMEEGIAANILAAQTKCIGDKVFGNMLLDISGGETELEKAINYLAEHPEHHRKEGGTMIAQLLANPTVAEAVEILKSEFLLAIWETFYVTVLATAFSIVIGLPLGVLIVAGESDGVLPLPKPVLSILNIIINLLRSVPFLDTYGACFPFDKAYNGYGCGNAGVNCTAGYRGGTVCGKAC